MKNNDESIHAAPGHSARTGLTVFQLFELFPDEEAARKWFEDVRWHDSRYCGRCGSKNTHPVKSGKPMPYWCTDCRKYFSVKTGTPMECSNLSLRKWVVGIYLMTTSLKGVSSMKLHRDLGITQKTAWYMNHRIRKAWDIEGSTFTGPVEVDETYIGGLERNKHSLKKLKKGRGAVGKVAVIGMKDRDTNTVVAKPIQETDRFTLQGFVLGQIEPGAKVYTDEHPGYDRLPNHESVKHSARQYVDRMAHTNGMESFWALLKRGYHGTFHHVSEKHLGRYVNEFSGRHNQRKYDTINQMAAIMCGLVGKRLRYRDLVG